MSNDELIKRKMIDGGFTIKDINYIQRLAEKKGMSYSEVIPRVRRVCIGLFVFRLFFLFLLISGLVSEGEGEAYGSLFAFLVVIITAEFFAPILFGAKILLRYKKII